MRSHGRFTVAKGNRTAASLNRLAKPNKGTFLVDVPLFAAISMMRQSMEITKELCFQINSGSKALIVPLAGIEPTAYPLGEGRSILLSYRGMGVKTPTTLSYKDAVGKFHVAT